MTDLTELRRLLDRATPQPWTSVYEDEAAWHSIIGSGYDDDGLWIALPEVATSISDDDSVLIAAAVNALPELLDAAEALTAEPTEAEVEAAVRATERVPMHMSNEDRCRAALRAAAEARR